MPDAQAMALASLDGADHARALQAALAGGSHAERVARARERDRCRAEAERLERAASAQLVQAGMSMEDVVDALAQRRLSRAA